MINAKRDAWRGSPQAPARAGSRRHHHRLGQQRQPRRPTNWLSSRSASAMDWTGAAVTAAGEAAADGAGAAAIAPVETEQSETATAMAVSATHESRHHATPIDRPRQLVHFGLNCHHVTQMPADELRQFIEFRSIFHPVWLKDCLSRPARRSRVPLPMMPIRDCRRPSVWRRTRGWTWRKGKAGEARLRACRLQS